ncbi:NrfD/PsrC family molybdoenzyme membrane anchor subunit [Comamonas testosteroni]|jgi:tetrathionate reductase subunit C|uniref:Polysulphide reductase NrfD n=1 Tax=Comamonas testosteroni (strain DSM 14576 / KF-1) TaxID=399795 RepID=B7WUT4_COMTK|nr:MULTISPECIES: NrfD/PsrC family molybdoenzyme membrane anchor subunit [Comamonas]EED67597.1 Polysulphide reductase NrfD [Comamonas testosteroni KF-1]TYK69882.1 tetrathionate reductase [Comamonas sp. Z3]WQG65740.1 NrfD/PsrC family molybdoenzyme membrane anchor subunit [Comamonas testosteroni]
MQIIELLTPAYEAAWLPWAVQYFFLVGVATGAALLASACALGPARGLRQRLLPTAVLVLAVSAIAAPVALLADLHQPARFWHFYAHLTPWSWMSLGAVLMPAFVGLCVLMCALWWLGRPQWMRLLVPVLVLSALSIVVYTGAEIMVIRARPLWNTLWVPINLALSGWLATVGMGFVLYRFLPRALQPDAAALQGLRHLGLWLATGLIASALTWGIAGIAGQSPSFDMAMRLFREFPVWRISMLGSAVFGTAVVMALLRGEHRMAAKGYTLVLGTGLAASAWAFRWALFMGVQGVPKFGAGLYLYSMPLGGEGLMGMLGVAGLCVALVAMATWALELFPAREPAGIT